MYKFFFICVFLFTITTVAKADLCSAGLNGSMRYYKDGDLTPITVS